MPHTPEEHESEWAAVEPGNKGFGLADLVLDEGVRTRVIGHVYGLECAIGGDGFRATVVLDRYNSRLKVGDYQATDHRALCDRLSYLAKANAFGKVFLKAHEDDVQRFVDLGFVLEGTLKHFYRGRDAPVVSRFLDPQRAHAPDLAQESQLIDELLASPRDYAPPPLPDGYRMIMAEREHIPQMVRLYRQVFRTYPTPLTHPDYIDQTMRQHILYRVVLDEGGHVVSGASAEMDEKNANAELTDCATLASHRGKALMFHLLSRLEEDLRSRGIMTGYTLAMAGSVGMNRVFHRLGYGYNGRLVNNCDIAGGYQDMNIWVRRLR
jgi:beta-lysine N6-acetyltransferase